MKLESYLSGTWVAGSAEGRPLYNPVNNEVVAHADATGIDMAGGIAFARMQGVAALRELTFAQRGAMLRAIADVLIANRDKYGEIARINSGNTQADAAVDIDGGIGTLKYYAALSRSLGDARYLIEPGQDQLAKEPVFFSRHIWTTRPGVAVQVNAFNFPSWGMWEKVAVATLAGVPSVAKPATATAWLSHEMMRDVIAASVVPEGVLSLVCGGGEGLIDSLRPMDSLAFTGSAETGELLRRNDNVIRSAPRTSIEADSVNAAILGPDATPGTKLFDLAVREITKALSIKCGQLCTNIRRVFVDKSVHDDLRDALVDKLSKLAIGDPANESVRVGPLVSSAQQSIALENINKLSQEADIIIGGGKPEKLIDADAGTGAFVSPTLLSCSNPDAGQAVHEIEVFGPCATLMPYSSVDEAAELAARAGGSLAVSLFSQDLDVQQKAITALAPWHGRILVVDEEVDRNHSGHAIVMPQCVHGGPGRAGGGEELGGLRGLAFHMQRSAVQGGPKMLASVAASGSETML